MIKRQSLRFKPDPNTLVYLKRLFNEEESKQIDSVGLVTTESKTGFATILLNETAPEVGELVIVKVGNLHAMQARVANKIPMNEESSKFGFEYLE
ncbi:MAG: hypothetical protein AB8E15_00325 [Bdellovibrionales bacterium]